MTYPSLCYQRTKLQRFCLFQYHKIPKRALQNFLHRHRFYRGKFCNLQSYRSKVHFATRYSDRSAIYIREEVDNRRLAIKSYGSFWKVQTWGERPEVIDETLLNCLKEKSFICDYHEDENSIYIHTSNKIDMVQLGQSLLKSLIGDIEK